MCPSAYTHTIALLERDGHYLNNPAFGLVYFLCVRKNICSKTTWILQIGKSDKPGKCNLARPDEPQLMVMTTPHCRGEVE